MTKFEEIKQDIINQLNNTNYTGDLCDIGNEIGIAIAKYTMEKDADGKGLSISDFISGVKHGVSLIDGTH